MSAEDSIRDSQLGFISTREDFTYGDLDSPQEPGGGKSTTRSSLRARTPELDIYSHGEFTDMRGSPLLKMLVEAEAAANSAAIQVVSFKDAMEDEFNSSRQSASDKREITRQRGLLLEKLENFKWINKSVRQKLKQVQEAEVDRIGTDKQISVLLKKMTQAESENVHLKRNLAETEKRVDELMDLRQKEQANMERTLQVTRSVEVTRAHLQGQLRNKEADNNRLAVQLRTLDRTLSEQRMEIDNLIAAISSLSEKASQEKEALKKAARAQKKRAERFEAAVDRCFSQLRERDVQLADAHSERDSWRRQQEQMTEERVQFVVQIELLKHQVTDLTARLKWERDESAATNENVKQNVDTLNTENADLNVSNAALKASVEELEKQLAQSEAALIEEKAISLDRKHQAEKYQNQVLELQAEVDGLRIKYESLLKEMEYEKDRKEEVCMVKWELQGRLEELQAYPELLRTTEQSLIESQDNLRQSERKCSEKSESIRQLQVKMDGQAKQLQASVEMKELIHGANTQLQEKVNSLLRKMEELQQENLELVGKLATQEESLSYSNKHLDQRSTECQALNRQLETVLLDVNQQVAKVKEKAASRDRALQNKVLELEAEKSRKETELKLLRQSKLSAEKQYEVRLKELRLSLDQSESHKQSIQNYVDFLKSSYATMFDEGLPPSSFGSYFLKSHFKD
ncbi:outer dense fiber protein 2-like [Lampris incognitus]|uniref:outer dense fiber protein 2-like n=1 Tax=Lampris incognitus TaxID=2546036 RepID=UPI0024B56FD2|nr:outer dense fiber protein 2-like [Lampris incognitus]